MMSDEIIEELWRIKDSVAREHGHDVKKLAAYLRSSKRAKRERTEDTDTVKYAPGTGRPK